VNLLNNNNIDIKNAFLEIDKVLVLNKKDVTNLESKTYIKYIFM